MVTEYKRLIKGQLYHSLFKKIVQVHGKQHEYYYTINKSTPSSRGRLNAIYTRIYGKAEPLGNHTTQACHILSLS